MVIFNSYVKLPVVKLMMVMMMRTTTTMMLMVLLMVMTTENLQALQDKELQDCVASLTGGEGQVPD